MTQAPDFDKLMDLGARAYAQGDSAAAARIYRQAQELKPQDPTLRLRLAMALWHGENRADESLETLRALAQEYPQAGIFQAEAMVLNSMGRFKDAAEAANRAIQADELFTIAWRDLATATDQDGAPGVLGQVRALLARQTLTAVQRRDLHYAAATLLTTLGDADQALTHSECGNGLVAERWDGDSERTQMDGLRELFTPDICTPLMDAGNPDQRMIFIVGMPRSGTTLIERLLAAHPQIGTVGETPLIGRLFGQFRNQVGEEVRKQRAAMRPNAVTGAAAAYLEGIEQRIHGEMPERVIDKMPGNYIYLPFLALMFPNALIVHMRRHPLDTCLSCMRASFAFGLIYAMDQSTLGRAWRHYDALVDDWQALLGPRLHTVVYEDLVSDTEAEVRRVIQAAGLDWAPECAAPAEGGLIKTASATQARGDVSQESVGGWRDHAARLAPLIEALGGQDWIDRRWETIREEAETARTQGADSQ